MDAVGYVEEEYFLSGNADVYDWAGSDHKVQVIAGPGKYVTRILVRRPSDAARFSGNVEATVLNASLNIDFGGPTDFAAMVKQGDVWIGITSKAVTAKSLQRFDPVRYALLDWSNPAPVERRCPHPTMIPTYMAGSKEAVEAMVKAGAESSWSQTEDGLIWDMLGQLGLLLKSEQRSQILPGFSKPWVYMTGVSQSAIYIRTWVAAFHNRYRTPDGKPVYDGYLPVVGPAMIRINQCAADVSLDDPIQKLVHSQGALHLDFIRRRDVAGSIDASTRCLHSHGWHRYLRSRRCFASGCRRARAFAGHDRLRSAQGYDSGRVQGAGRGCIEFDSAWFAS